MIEFKNVIIGIETTCDDTGIGIWSNNKIIANVILSSDYLHQKYGGVVPEIAARSHEENLVKALDKALTDTGISFDKITHIAFANEPGLPGCLHVGKIFAKTLAMNLNVPCIFVNHLYSHIFSAAINNKNIIYPCLGLVVSGGHTSIYLVNSASNIILLDETLDDAIGEVYDKVGRALGLSYPCGGKIDALYDPSKSNSIQFLSTTTNHKVFSYSGIKTAALNYINKITIAKKKLNVVEFASSFQKLIITDFTKRVKFYLDKYNVSCIALGGGVSANSFLRSELHKLKQNVLVPEMQYTGDNGAMHAYYANLLLKESYKGTF
ncbi:tRNA (adenosine(37)-N6)-threonylcarbamoyltransferase complex transferase subunit TsaD [Mycoplasmoides alvi]|uniref:tRNA (adenosine(37)-N6)-threonylcarbamoyltransferase complex transferase subunit TsaD n=1 Tax=Mycoplasmoides alvi TaxID=78580 RepID=UPI00051B8C1E|nr:tRNA (adenosine(37)-N6)-threonylcarbamoyltransferase complex transferase subunit TsaD [Mycoplasmoides alvi]